ncbi:MAG: hypothetical protein IJY33_00150 [Oscillospiraceae bacterium]|nr:hypothetical protein [Oscillospiraceae bacterium]
MQSKNNKISLFELALFAMYGALMFISKILMEFIPNVHLIGMFIVLFTLIYRAKALIPLYVFIFLTGFYNGFPLWWVPYLYIWAILWGLSMLIPRNTPNKVLMVICPIVCSFHGFIFGALYELFFALIYRLNFNETIAFIIKGIPYDITHGISNFVAGLLVFPLYKVLKKMTAQMPY